VWDADTAATEFKKLMETYPNIRVSHFCAQFSGESVGSGNKRLRYIAEKVLPHLG
jgi:hypothetical protein